METFFFTWIIISCFMCIASLIHGEANYGVNGDSFVQLPYPLSKVNGPVKDMGDYLIEDRKSYARVCVDILFLWPLTLIVVCIACIKWSLKYIGRTKVAMAITGFFSRKI